ncbi:LacI family transcriptional regulator [Brevibacillus reuszeri]|uniref:LacI family transcriptional regulator n=1 Tax=Brevibacillus reuszeri TaxID=54915 RepID=A0A0K9YPC5_9BACL|nr:LacI family DNA-binding transcriptional regulator [Brevibacillus reuszeri]KNB70502.1 ribose operon repressor [Brevibacillus reuszeri]MED1861784.1 LacI family DNA-binding transcriptional regulator [Brevibacillus reuszeri]GED72963.1 LacI family transcriptional regulator [Brevibacillus reuszeri]
MKATIRDVAKLAGVSVATVSRVMNQKGYVNSETEQKVNKAMQQLKFEPNQMARGLAGKRTKTIALILPDISNPFFPGLARGVEDIAQNNGYTVILCNSDDMGVKERSYIEVLKKKYIDGIIFATNNLVREDLERMEEAQIPFVMLDRAPNMESGCVIKVDNFGGAKAAVEHLLNVGCKKIAHVYGPQELTTAKERLAGYEEVAKQQSWYTPTLMIPGDFTIDGGIKAVEALLGKHPDLDGIFAGNDQMAVGVLKGLKRRGISVPGQVAVCGFDGVNLTEITEPELSTIAQPIYQIGELAANKLIERINLSSTHYETVELGVSLIVRESTRKSVMSGSK